MRYLACSLVDGVLASTNIISPCPLLPATNIMQGEGRRKSSELVTEKTLTNK